MGILRENHHHDKISKSNLFRKTGVINLAKCCMAPGAQDHPNIVKFHGVYYERHGMGDEPWEPLETRGHPGMVVSIETRSSTQNSPVDALACCESG